MHIPAEPASGAASRMGGARIAHRASRIAHRASHIAYRISRTARHCRHMRAARHRAGSANGRACLRGRSRSVASPLTIHADAARGRLRPPIRACARGRAHAARTWPAHRA
ncbi:hypothetical protein EZV77_05540 [Burkholderia thailandensis]|nr:hypothetical protein CWD92_09545 [Burkholderia thailandensis]TBW66578.1 hypothetical protein EZV77_05540 [Burkholderia thailandensis]